MSWPNHHMSLLDTDVVNQMLSMFPIVEQNVMNVQHSMYVIVLNVEISLCSICPSAWDVNLSTIWFIQTGLLCIMSMSNLSSNAVCFRILYCNYCKTTLILSIYEIYNLQSFPWCHYGQNSLRQNMSLMSQCLHHFGQTCII